MAPGDDAVIGHQNRVVLVHKVRHQFAHLRRAGRPIRRHRYRRENFVLRNHAGWWLDSGHGETCAIRWMTMHGGDGTGLPFHNLQVHQNLARALLSIAAAKLCAFEIHDAHVIGFHESLRHERRRAEGDVLPHSNCHITPVAIHIRPLPQTATDVANL